MAGNILTPKAIWQDFSIDEEIVTEVISSEKEKGVTIEKLTISGRKTTDGEVSIFGVIAKSCEDVAPAILVVQDFSIGNDTQMLINFAKRGYTVLSIDLAGAQEGKEHFTVYPESIAYANFENVKDNLLAVDEDANKTCWYEWTCVIKYALKYLSSLPCVSKIGGFGVGEAATALWQAAGTDDGTLSAVVFALNAGWKGYSGIEKFGGMVEPQFSDNMYKFIAGVEPQTYAMSINCPTLMLSATNSSVYDCDRAYDTVSRINESYSAIHYSVGYRDNVNSVAFNNSVIFLDNYLAKESKVKELPPEVDLKCLVEEGVLTIDVVADSKGLKDLSIYVAEEITAPQLRCWKRVSEYQEISDNEFRFFYSPFNMSTIVTVFAQATYASGLVVGSKIIAKKFNEDEVKKTYKENIVYSSRNDNAESVLVCADSSSDKGVKIDSLDVIVKKGPMGIVGAYCASGILTFKMNAAKDKPADGAMLMLDAYSKEDGTLVVKLISDYFGQKIEYVAKVNVLGGDVWHNVKLELSRFKTAEGMPLKSYAKIQAMEFNVEGSEYLINNVLWV